MGHFHPGKKGREAPTLSGLSGLSGLSERINLNH
jgi:hypothetical protein